MLFFKKFWEKRDKRVYLNYWRNAIYIESQIIASDILCSQFVVGYLCNQGIYYTFEGQIGVSTLWLIHSQNNHID